MLSNDLKIAFRNLRKHKFFAALNIVGLALAMSVCLVVIMVIRDQLGYDEFHPYGERTYRINTEAQRKEGGVEKYASTAWPVGEALQNDYAVAETVVRLSRGLNADAVWNNLNLPISGFFTDPSFFKVFGFDLEAGNPETALAEPYSIVLSKQTAERFFGTENPLNQTLDVRGYGKFKVTGVLAKAPGKTHLEFGVLGSAASLEAIEKTYTPEEQDFAVLDNWKNYYASYVYVVLREGQTVDQLNAALDDMAAKRYQGMTLETRDAGYRFYGHSLGKITPAPEMLSNSMGRGIPAFMLWGLVGFVFILILFPCLNYANLTIARALTRAKEIGIRKVVGAQRVALIRQFLVEAMLTAGLALVLAWIIKFFLISYLQQNLFAELLSVESRASLLQDDALTWLLFGGFAGVVGILSGLLPAFYLAGFRPAQTLRDTGTMRMFSRLNLRKGLIVMQFAVSLIFMIVVVAMWRQMDYALTADYGFDKENILNVPLQGLPYDAIGAEIARDHRVVRVSAISHPIGTWYDSNIDICRTKDAEPISIRDYAIDRNFLENHGIALLAGQNFPSDASPARPQYVILNEKALEIFNLGSPAEAVGKTVWYNDSTEVRVQGVVKNFNFRPLTYSIGPLALRYAPSDLRYLNVRLQPGDPARTIAAMGGIWKKFDSVHPFTYTFLDEELKACYADMRANVGIIGFFGLLAISIACLGLLGIVTYAVETRTKEISIRKVIGASATEVALLLSRNFLKMLLLAVVLALPVGYFVGNLLLQTFAYRITLGPVMMGACAVGLLLLGILTVGVQTMRAASANPVEHLKSE